MQIRENVAEWRYVIFPEIVRDVDSSKNSLLFLENLSGYSLNASNKKIIKSIAIEIEFAM